MKKIVLFFIIVLIMMLAVTTWASMYENVFIGGKKIIAEPWGIATLFDTYFAFLTFYLWVLYKETKVFSKFIWLLLIIFLGNIAMAIYVLIEIYRLRNNFSSEKLLTAKR